MATDDISRSAYYFEKDYADLSMQQGRVLTDDDFNEGRHIARELQRRTGVDLVGPYGSPDEGFSVISGSATADKNGIDFEIHNGTLYIGGIRLELSAKETFKLQKNWLQYTEVLANANDIHLVYVEVWQQPVSAVEDSELFEVALGGPDTATRLRTMWRVKLHKLKNSKYDDCTNAWRELVDEWKEGADVGAVAGTLTASNELIPDTTLEVAFDTKSVQKDLCKPSVAGGYLGAENQAIRVQILDDMHFTWGFDNGSPLYRVTVSTDKNSKKTFVKLITEPKDQAHWPKAGQVVEFLPWSAILVNGEKLAEELQPGHLAKIESGYDPDDKHKSFSITPATALPEKYGEKWDDRSDSKNLLVNPFNGLKLDEYLFMRVWDRGDDLTSNPKITIADKAKLGTTGLDVTFNNKDRRPGDYWIIAARPETPNKVVPWQLEDKRAPNGIRRFYAPLATIKWTTNNHGLEGKVQDCRKTFRPLTEIQTCCTRTVGDGMQSHGDFSDLQTAIDSLPESGGEICVLPGEYTHEKTIILKDDNVTIRGCGVRSKLLAPTKGGPVIKIEDCVNIKISSLQIVATDNFGIELKGKPIDQIEQQEETLKNIELAELTVMAIDRAAIVCANGSFVTLRNNKISLKGLETFGYEPAVLIHADDLLIEGNHIIADDQGGAPKTAMGGLQIGGGSVRVEIRRNKIEGGNGDGITLGSVRYVSTPGTDTGSPDFEYSRRTLVKDPTGCIRIVSFPKRPTGRRKVLESDGSLSEVRIIDNLITKMGKNGIGVQHFFDLLSREGSENYLIAVDHLFIENNQIRGCKRLSINDMKDQNNLSDQNISYGGIALATGKCNVIRNNIIEDNGSNPADPTCGIFVLYAKGITIEGNRILYNGGTRYRIGDSKRLMPGNRGGIVILFAAPEVAKVTVAESRDVRTEIARQDGVPAARIQDNIVVSPEGRALKLVAIGPVSVQGNQFTSFGSNSLKPKSDPIDAMGGAVVAINNLGVSNELYGSLLGATASLDSRTGSSPSVNGNIQFNDNQVVFDALDKAESNAFSSILLFSLDDISMANNQSDCDLSLGDSIVTNTIVIGMSVRVVDNRFKEGWRLALASATTFGWFNTTTDNQGTHCFLTNGIDKLTVAEKNKNLSSILSKGGCEELQSLWKQFTDDLLPSDNDNG